MRKSEALSCKKRLSSSSLALKFQKRNGSNFQKICGESYGVDDEVYDKWKDKLVEQIEKYESEDIFNNDFSINVTYKCT